MKTAAILAISTLLVATAADAKLYKWKDENGVTHYGDSIPMKYRKQEHQELSKRGITVKERDAMPTEEELAEERRKMKLKAAQDKIKKEQERRDRVLLSTYTTERDIVVARDARIEAVDSQIQLSKSIIEDSQRKLDATEKRITQLEAQNKTVPADLYAKMEREKKSLATHEKVMAGHTQKRAQVSETFDGYIERFRELKAEQKRKRDELDRKRREAEAY